jgi:hypothetical protein
MYDFEHTGPGRKSTGDVKLTGIKVKSWIAEGLKTKAAEIGRSTADARRAAYVAYIKGPRRYHVPVEWEWSTSGPISADEILDLLNEAGMLPDDVKEEE